MLVEGRACEPATVRRSLHAHRVGEVPAFARDEQNVEREEATCASVPTPPATSLSSFTRPGRFFLK